MTESVASHAIGQQRSLNHVLINIVILLILLYLLILLPSLYLL